MTEPKDDALTTLISRLAGHEMIGMRLTQGAGTVMVASVATGKVGSIKPPPPSLALD